MKPNAPSFCALRIDVDNLAKFVLDGLSGCAYTDDSQVVLLFASKVYDNDGHCLGATEIKLRSVGDAEGVVDVIRGYI